MPAGTDPDETPGSSRVKQTRSFLRAVVATSYLLGKRHQALGLGLRCTDALARETVSEIAGQLSHAVQAQRARVLAAEVGRLMRSLDAQRLK
jgi:hypothetical protein